MTSFSRIESPTLQAGTSSTIGIFTLSSSSLLSERIETSSSESSEPNFNSIPTNMGKTIFILETTFYMKSSEQIL